MNNHVSHCLWNVMQSDFLSCISPACVGGKSKTLNLWSGNKDAVKISLLFFLTFRFAFLLSCSDT